MVVSLDWEVRRVEGKPKREEWRLPVEPYPGFVGVPFVVEVMDLASPGVASGAGAGMVGGVEGRTISEGEFKARAPSVTAVDVMSIVDGFYHPVEVSM